MSNVSAADVYLDGPPFPLEDRGRFATDFLPCLLAFAHVATLREVDSATVWSLISHSAKFG